MTPNALTLLVLFNDLLVPFTFNVLLEVKILILVVQIPAFSDSIHHVVASPARSHAHKGLVSTSAVTHNFKIGRYYCFWLVLIDSGRADTVNCVVEVAGLIILRIRY